MKINKIKIKNKQTNKPNNKTKQKFLITEEQQKMKMFEEVFISRKKELKKKERNKQWASFFRQVLSFFLSFFLSFIKTKFRILGYLMWCNG